MIQLLWTLFKWAVGAVLLFLVGTNIWIVSETSDLIKDDLDDLKRFDVAVVFGTSRYMVGGGENLYFENRMAAAAALYKEKVVRHLILSGDNNTKYYNEPAEMKKAIVAKGVPENSVTLDYAGFRTLDTVVRGKEVFGQDKLILVTQKFHGYRALFIAQFYGIDAICYPAKDPGHDGHMKVLMRELLARPKAVIDLYILRKSPKFLGQKEAILFD